MLAKVRHTENSVSSAEMIPFDFNVYSSLLLPAFIHGLLFSVLAFRRFKREGAWHDLALGLLLTLLSIRLSFWMLGFAGWYDRHDAFTSFMFYFPFNTLALIGPCLYFYFISVTNRDFKPGKKLWPHLVLPGLLLLLCLCKFIFDYALYYPFPRSEALQYGTRGPLAQLDKTDLVYIVSYTSLIFYLALILRSFRAYRLYLGQHFSDTGTIGLEWLQRLLLFTGASVALLLVFYLAGFFMHNIAYITSWYPYLLLGLVIYYTGVNGYYNSPVLSRQLHFSVAPGPETANVATIPPAQLDAWKHKLEEVIGREQLYLRPELTLAELARYLQINTGVMSRVINEGYGLNFNEYINELRIKAVIRKLDEGIHKRLTLMGIAYDCGFNAKTTFNRCFKKVTGLTPGDYIKTSSLQD